VLPPLVVARCGLSSAGSGPIIWGDARSAMTTQPSSLSTLAMSAGEESEPTVRTAIGILAILYGMILGQSTGLSVG